MTPRKKPLIYGPDGKPLVRVNDRLAPKPKASAGLEGWVSWGLIDRKGNKVKGGEQHNLILDTFLDRIAVSPLRSFSSFLIRFAVGTGSTPPDVTDIALDNELARTGTQITSTETLVSPGVYELVLEREFDFGAANGNLTEFGFAYDDVGDMLVRELFRDGGGNPITVTKTSDYKLRIKYTLTLTLLPVTLTPISFTVAGIGLLEGDFALIGGASGNAGLDFTLFSELARGSLRVPGLATTTSWSYTTITSVSIAVMADVASVDSYTQGQHARKVEEATMSTSRSNVVNARSIYIYNSTGTSGTNTRAGAQVLLDAGSAFTKDNLHTLTLDEPIAFTWGRA